MANTIYVLEVAAAIKDHSLEWLGFNMSDYIGKVRFYKDRYEKKNGCNTVACIAGWAYMVKRNITKEPEIYPGFVYEEAKEFLGITDEQAAQLFLMRNMPDIDMAKVTPEQAVRVLLHLAKTNEVDWSVAL